MRPKPILKLFQSILFLLNDSNLVIVVGVIFMFSFCTLNATNYTWIGGATGSWNVNTNWSPQGIPGQSSVDAVSIVNSSGVTLDLTTGANTYTLTALSDSTGTGGSDVINLNSPSSLVISTGSGITCGTLNSLTFQLPTNTSLQVLEGSIGLTSGSSSVNYLVQGGELLFGSQATSSESSTTTINLTNTSQFQVDTNCYIYQIISNTTSTITLDGIITFSREASGQLDGPIVDGGINGGGFSIVLGASLSLSNASNEISQGIYVSGGSLRPANGSCLGEGTITLSSNAELMPTGLITCTNPFVMENSVTINTSFPVTFNGPVTAQGGSTINFSGGGNITFSDLRIPSGTCTVSSFLSPDTGTITLGGTLYIQANTTIEGRISGSGGIYLNSGTLVLTNPLNTFSQGITVFGSTLEVNNAGALGSGTITLTSEGTFQPTSAMTCSNTFSIPDSGLINNSSYPLSIDTINATGALVYEGTTPPAVTNLIIPSSQLVIYSNGPQVAQTITVYLQPSSCSSLSLTNGLVLDSDETLNVHVAAGSYLPRDFEIITTSSDQIVGEFSSFHLTGEALPVGIGASLAYTTNSVILVLSAIPLPALNLGFFAGNNLRLAKYLNPLRETLGSSFIQLTNLSQQEQIHALEMLNPARNADVAFMTQNLLFSLQDTLSAQVQKQVSMLSPSLAMSLCDDLGLIASYQTQSCFENKTFSLQPYKYSMWALGLGDFTKQKKAHENPAFTAAIGGGLVGFNWMIDTIDADPIDTLCATLALGYTHTSIDQAHYFGSATVNTGYLAVQTNIYFPLCHLEFAWWNGLQNINTVRHISFPGFSATAGAEHAGYIGDLHWGFGRDYRFGRAHVFTPFVRVDWGYSRENAYVETGASPYNMYQTSRFSSTVQTELGMNTNWNWHLTDSMIGFQVKMSYLNRTPLSVGKSHATIVGSPGFFNFVLFSSNQNLFSPRLQLLWLDHNLFFAKIAYYGEYGSNWITNEFTIELGQQF